MTHTAVLLGVQVRIVLPVHKVGPLQGLALSIENSQVLVLLIFCNAVLL